MSEFFEHYYLARGVKLLKHEGVASLKGDDRIKVSLSSGRKISCDMVVAGVGASPVTELFAKSGLAIDNGIAVNEYLETNQSGIFAAGDVANYVDKIFDKRRRVDIGTTLSLRDSIGRVLFAGSDNHFCTFLTSSLMYSICRTSSGGTLKGRLKQSVVET